jgi:pimeloyl-ACP methyl ester carboxylesterase
MRQAIPFAGPVRLLHGMQDAEVPYQTSLDLAARISGADVRVTPIEDGDHRLSRDQDIAVLTATLGELLD